MNDELRDRVRRADPAAGVRPPPGPAPHLLERTMTTTAPASASAPARRRPVWVAATAAAVLVAGVGGWAALRDTEPAPAPTLELALSGAGTSMSSCLPFDAAVLRDMSPAFAGTVVELADGEAVLEVDRWYAGGDAERVVLATPDPASSASLDGVELRRGERYLVTASEGSVNGCGYSGPATPELERAFDEAF